MTDPLQALREQAAQRECTGMRRTLRPRTPGEDVLDLASNDYLGLAREPRVVDAAVRAVQTWGAGSTGSRLVTGSTALHAELEGELARFTGAAGALLFSSGYLANLGAVVALSGPGALVVSDALNHASLVDACRLSRATVVVTPHRDVAAVEAALRRRTAAPALVVTDAVFSVDGDAAPLADLHAVSRRHGALLLVDEAHSLGVVGPDGSGAVRQAGLAGEPDVVQSVTLSKSLGSQGGAVLGDAVVVEHLINTARSFIFDTGLAPAAVGAAAAALEILRAGPGLADTARQRAADLAAVLTGHGLQPSQPDAAVVSAPMRSAGHAVDAAAALLGQGVRVGCFRPPSVPDGVSRLRLTARADLTDTDLQRFHDALAGLPR
ncbi:MAG: 8-amino-7-oxononanoate synthase [Actinomycetota bacterium]|nr:8-amino-7-oxononanoate synthase [Actinomycetota bacterium]